MGQSGSVYLEIGQSSLEWASFSKFEANIHCNKPEITPEAVIYSYNNSQLV